MKKLYKLSPLQAFLKTKMEGKNQSLSGYSLSLVDVTSNSTLYIQTRWTGYKTN